MRTGRWHRRLAPRRGRLTQVSPVYFDGLAAACLAHGFSPRVIHETRGVASQVVTTAVAWSKARNAPPVQEVVALLGSARQPASTSSQ
jgi:hypothetical protein